MDTVAAGVGEWLDAGIGAVREIEVEAGSIACVPVRKGGLWSAVAEESASTGRNGRCGPSCLRSVPIAFSGADGETKLLVDSSAPQPVTAADPSRTKEQETVLNNFIGLENSQRLIFVDRFIKS